MSETMGYSWENKIVSPEFVMSRIEPGMSIFIGTGTAEPRTLVQHLMTSNQGNLQDLEVIQLVSLGDTVPLDERYARKFRLKTFFSGWTASDAITAGRVDIIPSRFSRIPWFFKSGAYRIDIAFIQITPPDESGYATLGVGVDVSRRAMENAKLVIGEISHLTPRTLGDTIVHVNDFDYLVETTEPPIYFPRWPVDEVYQKLAVNIASVIPDGSCFSFGIGPIYEALAPQLKRKRHLGIHTPFFTDPLMDLVKSGAVTNRKKKFFRGKCLATYTFGTQELMLWLDRNPMMEFQPLDVVLDPKNIGLNDRFIAILPARKADLTGDIALHVGKGNVTASPGAIQEFAAGAAMSANGKVLFALPSRNLKGLSNIVLSVSDLPHQFSNRESLDLIVTEYGVAYLTGRTVRERALALIDIAHPGDREKIFDQAKQAKLLYSDQIYYVDSEHLYPDHLSCIHTFKDNLTVRLRAIKSSDEDEMRRLFYRFSDQAVYYRYFSPIKTMPHPKMQEYVNIDYNRIMSIVGVVDAPGAEKIIAEARYVRRKDTAYADTAFIVDEDYQGKGIASFLFDMLTRIAKDNGIEGFTADVLVDNKAMLRVYEKAPFPMKAQIAGGVYELTIPFAESGSTDME